MHINTQYNNHKHNISKVLLCEFSQFAEMQDYPTNQV